MTAPPTTMTVDDFLRGVWRENPVVVQMLGLCPVLAVTNTVANGLAMAAATAFVLLGSNLLVSLLKKLIPHEVRITSYVLIIATFVTVADMLLEASVPVVHKQLGPFVALIVVNCMILGRAESFASRNGPGRSLLDAMGTATGFTLVLLLLSGVRELLGSGTLLGIDILGARFEPWVIMVLPPGGFLTLGVVMLLIGWRAERRTPPATAGGAR